MRLPLIIALLPILLQAQQHLRNDYSVHDQCPDPKKNRIASRTIYTNKGNELLASVDTAFEKYDRNGNLIALDFYIASPNKLLSQRIYHHFFYDTQQRIVRDSHDVTTSITYDYSANGDTVFINNPTAYWNGEIVKSVIWYNRKNRDTTELGFNEYGDTIYYEFATRNQRTEISKRRNNYGFMVLVDSSVIYTRTDMKYTRYYFLERSGEYRTTMDISRFDKRGRVTSKEYLVENNFRQSIELFEYNKKGHLARRISTIYPHHYPVADTEITKWEMKYLYDPKGRLAQTQSWCHHKPSLLYLTSYIYNDRNLLGEIHRVVLEHGAVVEDERERFVYAYYQ